MAFPLIGAAVGAVAKSGILKGILGAAGKGGGLGKLIESLIGGTEKVMGGEPKEGEAPALPLPPPPPDPMKLLSGLLGGLLGGGSGG